MLLALTDITTTQLRETCGADPDFACRELLERTENRSLAEVADFVFGTPLTIMLILIGALVVHRLVGRAIERALRGLSSAVVRERSSVRVVRRRATAATTDTPETTLRAERRISALTSILRSVSGFVIMLLAIFMVLGEIGIDVAPLLAGAGVIGVALGFGSQSLVKDFLSGMFILVEDQFGVGDVIDLDGSTSGTVEALSLRTTRLRSQDGTVWYVPNGAIARVGNRSQHWSRAVMEVEVAPGTDPGHAERAVKRVADALCRDSDELLEQPEILGVDARDGATVIQIALKTMTADRDAVTSDLRRRVEEELAREGIELPAARGDAEASAVLAMDEDTPAKPDALAKPPAPTKAAKPPKP